MPPPPPFCPTTAGLVLHSHQSLGTPRARTPMPQDPDGKQVSSSCLVSREGQSVERDGLTLNNIPKLK